MPLCYILPVTDHTPPPPQTNGTSNGLVPMLRVYNNTARYVDQGGNKRPGAFAMYLEPWHADVFDFLDLKKNHGSEEKVKKKLIALKYSLGMFSCVPCRTCLLVIFYMGYPIIFI